MIFSFTISSLFFLLVGSLRNKVSLRLHCSKSIEKRYMKSAKRFNFNLKVASNSLEPINVNERKIPAPVLAATTTLLTVLLSMKPANALKDIDEVDIYKDIDNGFSVAKLPGWSIMPKQPPTLSLQAIQPEEVIFVASSFMEGASITITRSNAGKLLKDFNIDWWFAPLNSMADVGSPELIAGLLSLQHQGVGEKRGLPERVFQPTFVSDSEFEKREAPSVTRAAISKDNVLTFEYVTPLAGADYKTLVKAHFRNNSLIVIWISALASVWNGDYGERLMDIKDSFLLVEATKKK